MTDVKWTLKGREFAHCNCAYGCPCQFNALPTHGYCQAVVGIEIAEGHHGDTRLDGLRVAGIFAWPGPIHEGHGEAVVVIDERATDTQREALLRILGGEDTEPGATIFNVFAATLDKVNDPIFTGIDFDVDVEARKARLDVPGVIEARGEPILNPVTGAEHRIRIDLPHGFEYAQAEVGRGWATTQGPMALHLADSHAHYYDLHMNQSGVVR
jgi:hypothetical protein